MVKELAGRIERLDPPRPELFAALDSIMPALEQARVTQAVVHGDFSPWNLRTHGGKLFAFDWEYGELDGLPLVDEIHFRLQVGLEMQKWNLATAARFLNDLRAESGLTHSDRRAITGVYLLDQLARLYGEGYSPEHDMVAVYRKLLERLHVREPALI
jgi:hypothetical protein